MCAVTSFLAVTSRRHARENSKIKTRLAIAYCSTMSLDSLLDDIVNSSSSVATLEFSEAANGLPDYLLSWNLSRRQLIRDAEPYECKLFTAVDGATITSYLADVAPTSLAKRNPRRPNVDKFLTAANTLNQICNLPNVKERIESLAQRHEEAQINMDYLESAFAKHHVNASQTIISHQNETELVALSKPKQLANPAAASAPNDASLQKDKEEIRREQAEIGRLEKRLREKEAQNDLLDEKLTEQFELREQEVEMDVVMDQLDDMSFGHAQGQLQAAEEETIAKLERELVAKRRQLQEYDEVLTALDKDPTARDVTDSMPSTVTTTPRRGGGSARPRNSFQSLKARWEKVERASDGNEHRITRSLQALIEDLEKVQEIDDHIALISQINNTFIDSTISQGDPNVPFPSDHSTNPDASFTSVSSFASSSVLPLLGPRGRPGAQTVLAATALAFMRDAGGELPFAELKTRLGGVARAQGVGEGQAVQD
ncbi:hypothetical protein BC937DRAFT_94693 [Endogone sp. FLAS-F59071]|nr:hypothetical protein BC937DRAFT_94693 [Endogone sp. FLAS-F59071]|eukprot:RUS20654.1 hypothetical protein BC937DRAFT_94693 [Endogone sp. FLAS-F59071]